MPIAEPPHVPVGLADAVEGCILGTAAGDMLGLPFENLSRAHVARLLREPLEPSLWLGRGLVSDDTDHTLMLARSLLDEPDDAARFARRFAARLRWWLLSGPPGVGGATARGVLKLWLGWPPARSGVCSAGNGPAMRAALLGVVFADDPARLRAFMRASVVVTHTDPRAHDGALAVACAAACSRRLGACAPLAALDALEAMHAMFRSGDDAFADLIAAMRPALRQGLAVSDYAQAVGCGQAVTGFVMHTVPVAIYAWLRHAGDLRRGVTEVVRCGGDTDSVAAITGALIGAGVGPRGVPPSWLARTMEIPGTVTRMRGIARALAGALAGGTRTRRSALARLREVLWWPVMLLRNIAMFALLIGVLVRRSTLVAWRR